MAAGDLKKRLLQTLAASAEREGELHTLASDPRSAGLNEWGARDHVAHLAYWRRHAAHILTTNRTGGAPPDSADIDTVNAEVYAANRGRSADEITEDALVSYAELARAIDDCSDEDLLKARPGRETVAWEVVPPNGHLHLGEHLGFWHLAHGNEQAADQAQKWMLEVHEAAFTDPRSRAFGEYNLACYFAKQGRAADALPHLTLSLELHPPLKEWAGKDPDLDRIRQIPELRALLE
ncbi:MAG: maleylpyruvate isomerase N-terminal domain-containing protein [Candidatus Dormiibacterota bacterium]